MLNSLQSKLREKLGTSWYPRLEKRLHRLRRPAFLGTLGSTRPLSYSWGYDRGTPVDRYYIEGFLRERQELIRGRVLEVKDRGYTDQFGRAVERSDVLDIDPSNSQATVIADLSAAQAIRADQFDCFILTQTLQCIFDTQAALDHAHRILRPGGVLLVTVPAVSPIIRKSNLPDYWRFTPASCWILFQRAFGPGSVEVRSYGNMTSGVAFLAGLCLEELRPWQLDTCDESFPVIIGVCAKKAV